MSPNFAGSICARCDHFACLGRMMFSPGNHFTVHLRRRIGLQQFCLMKNRQWTTKLEKREHTSNRSQAQTMPFSSPATTVASPCPKQALHRYEELLCPVKSLSIFPLVVSMRRICESRVVTRKVWESWVGTTAVTGADKQWDWASGKTYRTHSPYNLTLTLLYEGRMFEHDHLPSLLRLWWNQCGLSELHPVLLPILGLLDVIVLWIS